MNDVISLVIPAHNESENISGVVRGCSDVLAGVAGGYELVLVDDGSTDGTAAAAKAALGADAQRLTVLRHERKSGYGITVCDGLRAARGDILGLIDGDGQFDPADLGGLLAALDRADLVTGRRARRADPWHRSVVSGVFNVLVRVLYGVRIRDIDCGLKVMRREVFEAASPILARSALFNTETYYKARRCGFRILQLDVTHHRRRAGKRSGGRLIPILRAVRDLVRLRLALRGWRPPSATRRP